MKKLNNHILLVVLLALLTSVAPMGVDTYIPSIPDIAHSFNVSIEKVELSLAIFLIGLSVGQIFGGPISDFYGRKKSSIYGLLGFSLFSFLIIFSNSIYEMWIYRFIEAFFGGIVLVNASAIVRDRFHGSEAAKVFSVIGTIRSITPLIAPAIGAFIIHFFAWEVVFVFLTLYPIFIIYIINKKLEDKEHKYVKQSVLNSFYKVVTHKKAMVAMLILGLSFSGLFIFIAKSSFIYIKYFNIPTDYFPLYFSSHFLLLILLTKVNIMMLKNFSPLKIMKMALMLQIIICILFFISYKEISLIETMIYLIIYTGLMAFIFGNSLALALEDFPLNAGVASSVAGVLQFGFAAIISSIMLSYDSKDFFVISLSLLILSILSFLIITRYKEN